MDIGNAIKEIRVKKGFTQKAFAKKCGLSANALCQIEKDNVQPQKNTIKKICKALNIPSSYLLMFAVEEEDVPEDNRAVFKALSGIKDLLIEPRS
jgi:transcriptional regulator with XRE-family HTH domain